MEFQNSSVAEEELLDKEVEELILGLPRERNWEGSSLTLYQGFWIRSTILRGVVSFRRHFKPKPSDIILSTFPKSGTIWLKALAFAILNRSRFPLQNSPLITTFPNDLVPFFEFNLYMNPQCPSLDDLPTPRIFATHLPYALLPQSVMDSDSRIVYMCRNPLDQCVSYWHFLMGFPDDRKTDPISPDEAVDRACNGVQGFGPIWEHVLGYWKAKKQQPQKILFLKYEDVKGDTELYVRRLADFFGCPFSEDEVSKGMIQGITELCSFRNMKNLEVNKTGRTFLALDNKIFFRKGEVGDWRNHINPSKAEKFQKLIEEKLSGSGLSFTAS